ncbi:MAG TPA: hypothetical protein DDW94_12730 [Deltaproteobacteria bacterium]|nr:MAG: hypothetical protein A2Z79_07045 [Deltaproteobacteria bacterium GWA2_55_82]OGQ63239.1 MAG: hypothetical protein A3I81_00555 [Deltaproteobacteria bacterium RIFCSPLOWO2_02_FULL_55_12]OIJ73074.1 MAG: hypothetical protein A2V21_301620 [Deltaproteobacteria bacterium GWC2_55_46]HBG47835.1 hypothetical protein [Deltaproteobacteria bacterium]HCY11902.1 hypothetical protein [Deltaproteobacteria bacterium]
MTTSELLILLALLTIAAMLLNLPFGYLRVKTRKFSVQWFLYIHLPIPFIFVMRTMAGLGYQYLPLMVAGAVAGQFIGGRLNRKAS